MTDMSERQGPLKSGCVWREAFALVTSRWGILILIALGQRPLRFYLLRDSVEGISEKMLSQTLKLLVRDGFVARHADGSAPPQVTYSLTPLGKGLAERLNAVSEWLGAHLDEVNAVRQRQKL
ncbi:transcriptional regulator [Paracoccus suum]|uniref:Transcriptional regulator n=1 Tax=Paracoccus suum TaxID=2259340 RepID=A0A344PIL7_9RHOB|nr:helix-turn-helix domain-containing protein [Paracoccus suum]AXC49222.1 transcriptional regulator [Paracoccus suum]